MLREQRKGYRKLLYLMRQARVGMIGLAMVAFVLSMALLAPFLSPKSPLEQNLQARLKPPFWEEKTDPQYKLGTDQVGRDLLSRLIYGSRISLSVGFLTMASSALVGITLGILAGYYRGPLDSIISNGVNIMMSFPYILLAISVMAAAGPGYRNLVLVLGLTGWPIYTRLVRAEVIELKSRDFVTAARALGGRNSGVILKHILPNLASSIIVLSTFELARMIIRESFLSFLGLGIPPPNASWGGMLAEGRSYMLGLWWLAAIPGSAIFFSTLGINLMGDGLRDWLDPHTRNR
ncbi:MAG: ABC transporter permease [Deltaproteobacteria bacterium]|nr:ABC transporter permease [Deltaproteobacteria bacterium]